MLLADHQQYVSASLREPADLRDLEVEVVALAEHGDPISLATLRGLCATTAEMWCKRQVHCEPGRRLWPWIIYAQRLAWLYGEDAARARLSELGRRRAA